MTAPSTETTLYFNNVDEFFDIYGWVIVYTDENRTKESESLEDLRMTIGIDDFDRITYSTTEGGYNPTDVANQHIGDYTSVFDWNKAPAGTVVKNSAVTNWDGNVGSASMDPVFDVSSGVFNYSALSTALPEGYDFTNDYGYADYYTYSYVTQFIVRSAEGNIVTLEIGDKSKNNPSLYQLRSVETVGTASDSKGTVRPNGRVESLDRQANNGWVKVEANSSGGDTYNISLTCTDKKGKPQPFQIGAVRVLQDANSKDGFYTSAKKGDENFGDEPHYSYYDMEELHWENSDFWFEEDEAPKHGPRLSQSYANKFSFFDRGTNLNCIVYTNPYTVLAMPDKDGNYPINVVVRNAKSYEGTMTAADRVCQELRLTDYDWGVSYDDDGGYYNSNGYMNNFPFTAKKVSYDRSFNTDYATVRLPFALTHDELQAAFGAEAYEYTRQDDNNAYFSTITDATTPEVPFMVKPTKTGANLVNLTERVISATDPEATSGMIGIYNFQDIGSGAFMFENNKFMPTAADADLKPFRAYFKPSGTSSARFYNFVIDNSTTGIDGAEMESNGNSHAPIYNISGQLVSKDGNKSGLKKGIYIQNNKKMIIK
jgi:hypothetical protein